MTEEDTALPLLLSPTSNSLHLLGGFVTPIVNADLWIEWLLNDSAQTSQDIFTGLYWAILQCTDSLVWGLYDGQRWVWSSDADRNIHSPERYTLLEGRVFGLEREVLIWRKEPLFREQFQGRILCDDSNAALLSVRCPLITTLYFEPPIDKPIEEDPEGNWKPNPLKRARPIPLDLRFWKREMPGGNITVTPKGTGVEVKQYLQEDAQTGALRVVACRAVRIIL